MTKTIEELASEYYLNEVINGDTCDDKEGWTDCFVSGAEALMQLPLASRLTAEEKERARKRYNLSMEVFSGTRDVMAKEYSMGRLNALESIFGADFFKEGE